MTARIANIELAQTVLATAAANVSKAFEAASGSLQDKLALALNVEQEVADTMVAIEKSLAAARAVAAARAAALRAEISEAALTEVIAMLRDGAVTLADIAARAGVAIEGNMTFERVVKEVAVEPMVGAPAPTSIVVAAPAPVQIPTAAADGTPLSIGVRENLRLQAGYMHPVKFRDPGTGAGWSGRGPMPKWLKALCVAGKTAEDFRVYGVEPAASLAPVAAPAEPSPAIEVAAHAQVAPSVQEAPAADAGVLSDIGEEVASFDASGLDSDLNIAGGIAGDDDIGEMVASIAAMNLDTKAGNAAQFLAQA